MQFEAFIAAPWRRHEWRSWCRDAWPTLARECDLSVQRTKPSTQLVRQHRHGSEPRWELETQDVAHWVAPSLDSVSTDGEVLTARVSCRVGQTADDLEKAVGRIGTAAGAVSWRSTVETNRTVRMDFIMRDVLAAPCRPRRQADRRTCKHGRPLWCTATHEEDDGLVGQPLCGQCYDYTSQVVWQWYAPELWRRTTIALRRGLAATLGVSEADAKKLASLQYAKVAEYQRRGVIHFHALIRLDGPDGPGSPAPLTGDRLKALVLDAVRSVVVDAAPTYETDAVRRLAWGAQVDARVVRQGARTDDPAGPVTPEQVAGYLAKYATKDATNGRPTDRDSAHVVRLRGACERIYQAAKVRAGMRRAGQPTIVPLDPKTGDDPYALMGKWEFALGFRGHFSSKSRRYSLTLGALRRARARFRALTVEAERRGELLDTRDLEARLFATGGDEEETTLVVGDFTYAGTGWHDATELSPR